MLLDRYYNPSNTEKLYHYCSAETLNAICSGKKIRFCDIFSMNDFMEMHWGYQVWEHAATELITELGKEFIDNVDLLLHNSGAIALPLASCFSKHGDTLSQWRAYGNDGKGYSIGFNAELLTQLAVRPLHVLYNNSEQINEVKAIIKAIHAIEESNGNTRDNDYIEAITQLAFDLAAFKNPAFSEENEIRLIHLVNFEPSNRSLRIVDAGGTSHGKSLPAQTIKFFMRDSVPVPYIDLDFTDSGNINPIEEIILGPKNNALPSAVSIYLETLGIPNVKVKKSTAPYR